MIMLMVMSYTSSRSSDRQVCTVALGRTFDRISEVQIPIDICLNSVRLVGSCNGLLCFAKHGSRKAIYFCNPSIRKFKTSPEPCLGHLKNVSLKFAYHSENNDYKVVRISSSPWMSAVPLPEIEVYTLSSDSWRSVGIEFTTNVMFYDYNFSLVIPLVSGAFHWLAHIKEGEEKQGIDVIMAFDVNTEKFRKLAALPHVFIETNPCDRYLTSFKRKLAFIAFGSCEPPDFPCSIWVMKEYGVVDSWIRLSVIPVERVALCIAFTEHGSLLTWSMNNQVENHGSKFVSFDAETLHKKDLNTQYTSFTATFVESLVLLDEANVICY